MKMLFGAWVLFVVVGLLPLQESLARTPLNDAQIKQKIIAESIAAWPGNCACPFNVARNGSHCGKRSAWSRPGGYSPICYADEVSAQMIETWREKHKIRK